MKRKTNLLQRVKEMLRNLGDVLRPAPPLARAPIPVRPGLSRRIRR